MIVTQEKPKVAFRPVNIKLEKKKELQNLINILEPGSCTTLKASCESKGIDLESLDHWSYELWEKLSKKKEDC